MSNIIAPIQVFCSYAQADEAHLRQLKTHLSGLEHQGLITTWHDRLIPPSIDKAQAIDTHLETATRPARRPLATSSSEWIRRNR